jgi:arginyl-tRNA--protein-N-Asp/Glu arginylyltransferase
MFNIKNDLTIEQNYANGLLPQRNLKNAFYQDTSCRSDLADFSLSSENRRILHKTSNFTYETVPLFFNLDIQKQVFQWLKGLKWDFPISSVKQIFTDHIFNYLYIWKKDNDVVAYSVCYFSANISHIAYVFYDPQYSHSDLPIRLVLQFVIDSQQKDLKYAYLGRFSENTGFYKRNMPGFEYFKNNQWLKL